MVSRCFPDHHPSQRRNSVKWIKSKWLSIAQATVRTLIDPVQQCVAACIDSRSGSEIFFTTRCSPSVIVVTMRHSFHPSDVQCQLYQGGRAEDRESHREGFILVLECGYRKSRPQVGPEAEQSSFFRRLTPRGANGKVEKKRTEEGRVSLITAVRRERVAQSCRLGKGGCSVCVGGGYEFQFRDSLLTV
ncbi:hypothetical protein TNCV_4275941 [Trichonephila clavipes]|nr:hypothetical protein TNCV_4275941 [Trichonephila clavipes]